MKAIVFVLVTLGFALPGALAPRAARAAETRAFVYATDFGSGSISTIAFGPPRTVTPNVAAVCNDAVLRYCFGHLAVVERFGCDNVRLLDPATWAVIRQFSVGNGSNPNDYDEWSPTKGYVARYDSTDLWIVDPSTGAHTGSIGLGRFADHDGIPEMNRMACVAGRLFVSCQRLDRDNFFSPTDSSLVAVIDCATDTLVDCDPGLPGVQALLLPRTNPTTAWAVTPEGDLLLGCTGNYGVNDGGVVRIDPRTLTVKGVEATEADLGGDVNAVAVTPTATGMVKAFCVISDASFNTVLVSYQRATGHGVHVVRPGAGFVFADLKGNDRDEIWLCDRTPQAPGVRVFAAANDSELTAGPLGVGLPPQDLAFDAMDPVAVAPGPLAAPARGIAFTSAAPNPSWGDGRVVLRLAIDRPGPVTVLVADARGRLVHRETRAVPAPGEVALEWNGQRDDGFRMPAGVYCVHASQRGRTGAAEIRLIRLSPKSHP
jgi:DNA-binding beta-propeller fold protein YncE